LIFGETSHIFDDVSGSIDARTFAIGLGTAQQVSTAALSKIAHNTGGYILLTGPLTPDTDGYFLLSKYFQQILVNATAENIVTDPSGFIGPKMVVRVPFDLAEADIDATVVLFVDVPVVRLSLETPAGKRLTESDLSGLGAQVTRGTNMTFCRFALPLPVGSGAHRGTWHAILELDEARWKRLIAAGPDDNNPLSRLDLQRLRAHGARYNVTVSSWSNVRMTARLTQSTFEPGATLKLNVTLSEYGIPVDHRAQVHAVVLRPDGLEFKLALRETAPGSFEADLLASMNGVWRVRVRAEGKTFGGSPFTREQLLSGAIIIGGDHPPQHPDSNEDRLKCLIECLAREPGIQNWLKEKGVDYERLRDCFQRCRKQTDPQGLDNQG